MHGAVRMVGCAREYGERWCAREVGGAVRGAGVCWRRGIARSRGALGKDGTRVTTRGGVVRRCAGGGMVRGAVRGW